VHPLTPLTEVIWNWLKQNQPNIPLPLEVRLVIDAEKITIHAAETTQNPLLLTILTEDRFLVYGTQSDFTRTIKSLQRWFSFRKTMHGHNANIEWHEVTLADFLQEFPLPADLERVGYIGKKAITIITHILNDTGHNRNYW
jgi:hypothetical protein